MALVCFELFCLLVRLKLHSKCPLCGNAVQRSSCNIHIVDTEQAGKLDHPEFFNVWMDEK